MNPQRWIGFILIGLVLLSLACQISDELVSLRLFEPVATEGPRSTFVPPREVIWARVGEPLPIESYHIDENGLQTLEIFVNGQPLQAEASGGQAAFPQNLAAVEIAAWPEPTSPSEPLLFPASPCSDFLLGRGTKAVLGRLALKFPSTTWSVCHIWTGHVPGVYELSLIATDAEGHRGRPIVQRIEVK